MSTHEPTATTNDGAVCKAGGDSAWKGQEARNRSITQLSNTEIASAPPTATRRPNGCWTLPAGRVPSVDSVRSKVHTSTTTVGNHNGDEALHVRATDRHESWARIAERRVVSERLSPRIRSLQVHNRNHTIPRTFKDCSCYDGLTHHYPSNSGRVGSGAGWRSEGAVL